MQSYTPEYRKLYYRLNGLERSFQWFFRNHSTLAYATGMAQLHGINTLSDRLKKEVEIFLENTNGQTE
jgi:hypothetical protein